LLNNIASRGNCLLQLNQIKEALREFERAIELNESDGYCYLNRALVYARLENYTVIHFNLILGKRNINKYIFIECNRWLYKCSKIITVERF